MLDALDAVTPLVEDGSAGVAFCEMRGVAGGPVEWMRAIRAAVDSGEATIACGVATNRFVARVAAGFACDRVCADGEEAAFVAPLPLKALGLEADVEARLHLLGIRTLGELAALPHGPFVRRFGPEAARWHLLARGIDTAPFRPRPQRARIERTLFGEGSATSEEQLLFALRTLVARIAEDLATLGKRAAELALDLECENGATEKLTVRIAQPTGRESMLFDLVRARLEGLRLDSAVVGLRLGVERMEGGGVNLTLFAGNDPDAEAVELALARLEAAFGEGAALRARVVEGFRPETRVVYERFALDALVSRAWKINAVPRRRGATRPSLGMTTGMLRMLEAEEIDVIVQGGAPRFVGTPPLAVVAHAGPWRTAEHWWSDAALARDDYDVMLEDGAIYRIAHRADTWLRLGVYD